MQDNNKSRVRRGKIAFIVVASLCYVLGAGSIIVAVAGKEWDIARSWQIALTIIGIASMLLFLFAVYRYLTRFVISHHDWLVEEKDERNEMIRGKVSVQSSFIMSFLSLAVFLILLVCRQWLAVILLGVIDTIEAFLRVFLLAHYEKQY